MVYASGALVVFELGLLVYCLLSVITTPEEQVRNLPKLLWLVLVVLLPLVGGISWLVAGRPVRPAGQAPRPSWPAPPGRPGGGRRASVAPDDDEAFLRALRERAEQQRREAQRQREEGDGGSAAP